MRRFPTDPMLDQHQNGDFETRYEWLRPGQLIQRRSQCPLIFFPLAPLEYHGPHLPIGVDPLSAGFVAHACCRRIGRGVVRPTMFLGTERERAPSMLRHLGLPEDEYVVGMDFPARQWSSHYLPEEVFALVVAAEIRSIIRQGYGYVFIVNGHGALNHNQVLRRLCTELSHTEPAIVDCAMSFPTEEMCAGAIGHADIAETSLMMYYNEQAVDLAQLPAAPASLKYADYSIVDDAGFTAAASPDRCVPEARDPRRASAAAGKALFDRAVACVTEKVERMLEA